MVKDVRGQMSVGKLLAIIMAVVIVVLIIVGSSQGWFKPLSEKITSKANEILIMFEKSKPSNDEEMGDCFVEENVVDSNGKTFNRTRCEDSCYLNNSDMLGDLKINGNKVTKIDYDKNRIIITSKIVGNWGTSDLTGEEYPISYLKNIDKELKSKKDLLKILEAAKKMNDDFKLGKRSFVYYFKGEEGLYYDFSKIEDYRFFSNKSFPMYVSLKYDMKEGAITIEDYIIKNKYDYLLENYYNKLYSLEKENNIELEREIPNKIDALAKIIVTDYGTNTVISGSDAVNDNTMKEIESECDHIYRWEIMPKCGDTVRDKDKGKEYKDDFEYNCRDVLGTYELNYFIMYKCYIFTGGGTGGEESNYFNILSSEFEKNIETKSLMIGLYKDEYNVNKKSEADEVLSELNNFKKEIDSVKQVFYNKITKQIDDLLNDVPDPQTLSMEEKKEAQLSPFIQTDNSIKFEINQTLNISNFYTENCGVTRSHIEDGVNIITYGDNYGIIYNSLGKFELRKGTAGSKSKECTTVTLPEKNYLIVEYNDKLKQWNLKLDDEYNIDNLENKIKELTELKNVYDYSKTYCLMT